jgi:hypothetical protein
MHGDMHVLCAPGSIAAALRRPRCHDGPALPTAVCRGVLPPPLRYSPRA